MMDRIWSRHFGLKAVCFGLIGALVYFLMINFTLAHVEAVSGHVPFDMRPLGYSPQDAAALLEGLGAEGRSYYLSRQIPLDTIYPALLALILVFAMRWFGQRVPANKLVWVGIILSVGAAVFDYIENLGIVAMILTWPDLSDSVVYASSSASVAKSLCTTLAVLCAFVIGCLWGWHRKTSKL